MSCFQRARVLTAGPKSSASSIKDNRDGCPSFLTSYHTMFSVDVVIEWAAQFLRSAHEMRDAVLPVAWACWCGCVLALRYAWVVVCSNYSLLFLMAQLVRGCQHYRASKKLEQLGRALEKAKRELEVSEREFLRTKNLRCANVTTSKVALGQIGTNMENLQLMMEVLRHDKAVFEAVQEQFQYQEDQDEAQFKQIMAKAIFDNKSAPEMEVLWYDYRELLKQNLMMRNSSQARMQTASNDTHEILFRDR